MSLSNVRVHRDWAGREREQLASDQRLFRAALAVVLLSIALATAARFLRLPFGGRPELVDAVIGGLYLGFTALAANRRGGLMGLRLPVSGPGWARLQIGALAGVAVGIAIALLLFLSAALAGTRIAVPWPPVPGALARWVVAFSLRSSGEEFVFRGALFAILYNRFGWGFWPAALVTVPLELALYLAQIRPAGSPPLNALAILGPCLMGFASTGLYAAEGGLVGPIVNNAVFQAFAIAVGLQ